MGRSCALQVLQHRPRVDWYELAMIISLRRRKYFGHGGLTLMVGRVDAKYRVELCWMSGHWFAMRRQEIFWGSALKVCRLRAHDWQLLLF